MVNGTDLFGAFQELLWYPRCFSMAYYCHNRDMNSEGGNSNRGNIYNIHWCRYAFIRWNDGSMSLAEMPSAALPSKCHGTKIPFWDRWQEPSLPLDTTSYSHPLPLPPPPPEKGSVTVPTDTLFLDTNCAKDNQLWILIMNDRAAVCSALGRSTGGAINLVSAWRWDMG